MRGKNGKFIKKEPENIIADVVEMNEQEHWIFNIDNQNITIDGSKITLPFIFVSFTCINHKENWNMGVYQRID